MIIGEATMNIYKVTKYKVSHHNYVTCDLHVTLETLIQNNYN